MTEETEFVLTSTPAAPPAGTSRAAQRAAAWPGVVMVGLGAIGFSTGIIFMRSIEGMIAPAITFYRTLFAFLFFCTLLVRYREPLRIERYRPHVRVLIGLGMAMGLTSVLYTYAVQHATAATAVLLNNSSPLYVALLSPWLLREPRPRATWISLGLAALGVALLTGLIGQPSPASQLRGDVTGIVAALASGFMYALPIMIGRHLRGKVGSMTQIWWGSGVAALMLLPVALGTDFGVVARNLPILIPLGVVALGLPYLLVFQGLQRISAQSASITALLEPVSGVLIGLLVYQEALSPFGLVGVALILGAIYLISRPAR